jgi:hypothetical protein
MVRQQSGEDIAVIPPPNPIPVGITSRPNPMTHPQTVISSWRLVSREEALAPIREVLDPARRQASRKGSGRHRSTRRCGALAGISRVA